MHPDSALENGHVKNNEAIQEIPFLREIDSRLLFPIFERSGWPMLLTPYVKEARSRFEEKKWSTEEYYCSNYFISGYLNHGEEIEMTNQITGNFLQQED